MRSLVQIRPVPLPSLMHEELWQFHNFGQRFYLPQLSQEQVRDHLGPHGIERVLLRYVSKGDHTYYEPGVVMSLDDMVPASMQPQEYLFHGPRAHILVHGPGGMTGNLCVGAIGFLQSYAMLSYDGDSPKAAIEKLFERELRTKRQQAQEALEQSALQQHFLKL
jgi:hypothetical protein